MTSTKEIAEDLQMMKRYPNGRLAYSDAATLQEAADRLRELEEDNVEREQLRAEVERLTAEKKAAAMNYEAEIDRLTEENGIWLRSNNLAKEAVDRLEARLTALEGQKPAAWAMKRSDGLLLDIITVEEHARIEGDYTIPLYLAAGAAPPNATQ